MTDTATWANFLSLVGVLVVAYVATMWIAMVFWTYRDIAARSADRMERTVAVAIVALFNAPGFLLYLALRPRETTADALTKQFESEALIQHIERTDGCPGCQRAIREDFVLCPYCRMEVRASCPECSRTVRLSWVLCPYCGADRVDVPSRDVAGNPEPVRVTASPRESLRPASPLPVFLPRARA